MNRGSQRAVTTGHIFRTMREMLLEASPEEIKELAREAGLDAQQLAETGRDLAKQAIQGKKYVTAKQENLIVLHKGLNSLLVMLRRRDGLDESELAQQADIDEAEVRKIEFEPGYVPHPRTIYKLEKQFNLPEGVLAKLSGAIKHNSPALEERALEFAANAKSIGKLTKAERQLLNEFVKFLTEKV